MRQYGWEKKYYANLKYGRNSRLDEIQAAILRVKLKWLDLWNDKRRSIAEILTSNLKNQKLQLPKNFQKDYVAHHYAIRSKKKNKIIASFIEQEIPYGLHYPIPDYKQEAVKKEFKNFSLKITEDACKNVFTIPCYPNLDDEQIKKIARAIITSC